MSRRVRFEPVRASSIPVVERVVEEALAIVQNAERELGVSDERECARCGDEVGYLSTRDWCDGCEALEICDECSEEATSFWPGLKEPVQLCDSCEHNARRSGWEPGA